MAKKGFILVEACLVTIILTFGLVALLPMITLSIKASTNLEQIRIATNLSVELMEEVQLRRWDELTPLTPQPIDFPSTIGLDASETASDKRTFDDVDDFNGWVENDPLNPIMQAVDGLEDYTRRVTVEYVNTNLVSDLAATDYKRIEVCTSHKKLKPVCIESILTNH